MGAINISDVSLEPKTIKMVNRFSMIMLLPMKQYEYTKCYYKTDFPY